jgi:flavin reductase (DIM6/NTAB) family NADH-FMN oxidoreductase RutF
MSARDRCTPISVQEVTFMIVEASTLDPTHAYKLLIGSILPRAIGWISTVSTDGVANLAPISLFTGAGRKPPMVCLTLQPKSDGITLKDTFVNIRDTGEFCFNMATLEQAHQMHQTAFEFPPEVDEFAQTGLEKEPSVVVKAPRVKGAPISFECRLHKIVPVGDIGDHVIIGEVVLFHIRDDLYLERGRIDTAAILSVGRLAAEYTLVENVFITPLEDSVVASRDDKRMHRLDGHPDGWSPIDTKSWSASGSVRDIGETL